MKLSKSTTILINVALVLLLAILVKSFMTAPQNANAAPTKSYIVSSVDFGTTTGDLSEVLNENAKEGWKFVGSQADSKAGDNGLIFLIFER